MTGVQKLIKKLWVKFDGMDIDCMCNEHTRKCRDKQCKEYVVKFTEIERKRELPKLDKEERALKKAVASLKQSETELVKSIKKFKRFRIH